MKPLTQKAPKLVDGCIKGNTPKLYYYSDPSQCMPTLQKILSELKELHVKDIVILTCKTESSSAYTSYVKNGRILNQYRFTTCRKYKGLEADAVVIVDIDETVLTTDAAKIFYVGASRARLNLYLVSNISEKSASSCLQKFGQLSHPNRNYRKQLATSLRTIMVQNE